MTACLALLSLLAATGRAPSLEAAERAFEQGEYQAVLPLLDEALAQPQPLADQVRAHELRALVHAAFDDSAEAIGAFTRALELDPRYDPGTRVSPKVRGLFAEARQRLGLPPAALPTVVPAPSAPPPEVRTPLTSRWWFWTGVAALAVGAGGVVWASQRTNLPEGNLPRGELR